MTDTNRNDGHTLERAVEFIQKAILTKRPEFQSAAKLIERNKIITVQGVRHEIDVCVTLNPQTAYAATYVFECKDHREPVGKAHVSILVDKLNALGATKGFLVARKLTKDARNRIKQDNRIAFVKFTDDFESPFQPTLWHTIYTPKEIMLEAKSWGSGPVTAHKTLEWEGKEVWFQAKRIEFMGFVYSQCERLASDYSKGSPQEPKNGKWRFQQAAKLEFEPGELRVGESNFEWLYIVAEFEAETVSKEVRAKYQLDEHGRSWELEPLENLLPGKNLRVIVTEIFR
jgi:hypothetical protein